MEKLGLLERVMKGVIFDRDLLLKPDMDPLHILPHVRNEHPGRRNHG